MYTDKKAKIILHKHNHSLKQKFKYLYSNALETAETTIPKHFFRNLRNVDIPEDIIDVVSLGPKFSINEKIHKNDIIDTLKN